MNKILKSVLTASAMLAIISSDSEVVKAEKFDLEIINQIEESTTESAIKQLELTAIPDQEDVILLSGTYQPKSEFTIAIGDSDLKTITSDENGYFEIAIETLELENSRIEILDDEKATIFVGTVVKEEQELPTITLDEVNTEAISGTTNHAVSVQVETVTEESISVLIEADGTFSIDLEPYNVEELVSIVAVDEAGNISEAIELSELLSALEQEPAEDEEGEDPEEPEEAKEPVETEVPSDEASKTVENEKDEKQPKASSFTLKRSTEDVKGTKYHFVQSGETLYSIATAYGVSVEQLQKWNDISNPGSIKLGDLYSVNGQNVYSEIDKENVTFTTTDSFINYIAPYAEDIAEEHGLYTSVMIAQAIHESGWGKSNLATIGNNLFGVKGTYNGNSVVMLTWEEKPNGEIIWIQDGFRLYPTFYESIVDNADKLRNGVSWDSNFYRGAWLENTASHFDVTEWLTGRYATDSNYATKINRTIANYNLTRFDKHISISNPITSQKPLNREAIVQASGQDIYSQPKGTASDQLIGNTSTYVGQKVQITQEKVNSLGTWWQIEQDGKVIGWVNTNVLSNINYTVTDTKDVEYTGTIVKPWSINTQPWGTSGAKQAVDVNDYMNQVVNIIQEKTTDRATYALVSINGQTIGWIDKDAILSNTDVKSTHDKNYAAKVTKPWSINTEPYGTHGYKFIKNANEYVGKVVEVVQEKVTNKSTYALMTIDGDKIGWIDKGALEEHKVLKTTNVRYVAEVTKPWAINSLPWGINGFSEVDNGSTYLGETLNVIQEKQTDRSTYLLLQKDGRNIGWIDEGAVNVSKDITAARDTHYAAKVTKPWSINSKPWGSKGYKAVYGDAQQFVGQTVEVFQEQLTDRSTYALLTLNGKELGWMDVTGIEKQQVTSTKNVDYQAEIVHPWSINSQPWGVEGFTENYSSAANFVGKMVNVKQEKITPRGTYALIILDGQELGWIDKGALNLYPILSTTDTSYKATITKPWSINTQPWGTNGYKTVVNNNSYVGKTIDIVQEQVTSKSTYGLIRENGKNIGWIDITGIQKLEVLSTKNTNYAAEVTKPWSINSQPWGVEGSKQVMAGSTLVGDTVIVTQEKTTPRSTYALLTQNGEELGWIDITGIDQHTVTKTRDVFYTAKVTKPWSINTQPWGVAGFREVPNVSDYLGGTYDVIQEKVTKKGTYGLLSKTGNVIGWIDLTGMEKHSTVKSMRKVTYTAKLVNPWSINTEPWGTVGASTVYENSSEFVGKTVTIISEKVTNRSTYVLIVADNKILGWIDKTALA